MFSAGRNAALSAYGLKTAGWFDNIGETIHDAAATARLHAVGAPGTWGAMKNQAQTGTLTSPGGAYHKPFDYLIPKFNFGRRGQGFGARALATGGTALSLLAPLGLAHAGYRALKAPPESRGEAVGELAGNVLGGALGTPFGMLGQGVGSLAGSLGGGALGRHIGNAVSPPQESFVSPQ